MVCVLDELMVSREYDVFLVALRWLVHGGRDRVHYVVRVFELIRYTQFLFSHIQSFSYQIYAVSPIRYTQFL